MEIYAKPSPADHARLLPGLKAVTPDSLHYLLHDLFAANTFWELKTELATAKQTRKGIWEVTLQVETRKVIVDSTGVETNIAMNDWIEIGIYTVRAEGESSPKLLYLQKHRIGAGKQHNHPAGATTTRTCRNGSQSPADRYRLR